MAKKSMLMRQKRRERAVKKYAKKRAELKELIRDPKTVGRRQGRGAGGAAEAAARREPGSAAQSLRAHGPAARLLPQVRSVAHEAARDDDARRDPGPREGELVSRGRRGAPQGIRHEYDRSDRRHADAHSQRADGAPAVRHGAVVEAQARDREGARAGGLPRLRQASRTSTARTSWCSSSSTTRTSPSSSGSSA